MVCRLLALLLLCATPAHADVYMFKGLGGVWSAGLGEVCAFLTDKKGIHCHFDTTPVANGRGTIVLVGHSMGGATAIGIAKTMKVNTVILLDPVGSVERLPARTISISSAGWGNRVSGATMTVHCKDCSHTSVDDNEGIQYLIIKEAVAAHGKSTAESAPTVQKKVWRRRR